MSTGWKIYWVTVAAAVTNYMTMVLWSLPLVSEMADGSVPFDVRPGGYSLDDALLFLSAIDDTGRDFYLDTQQFLDLFYPALFAITVAIPLVRFVPRFWGLALAATAIAAGVFDYLENAAVAVLLTSELDAVTESMVNTASNWTIAKSISTTIASVALVVVLVIKCIKWIKTRKAKGGEV